MEYCHLFFYNRIKKSKEESRLATEHQARLLIEPRDPVTGETPTESFSREVRQEQQKVQEKQEKVKRSQKNKEAER